MSTLATALADYLVLRRSLGYKLERPAELLADFVARLDSEGASHISVEAALAWAIRSSEASDRWRATQLGVVRCFARYAQALDPAHEVPPTWLLPSGRRRPAPYIRRGRDHPVDGCCPTAGCSPASGNPGGDHRSPCRQWTAGGRGPAPRPWGPPGRTRRTGCAQLQGGQVPHGAALASTVGALEAYLDRRDECCPNPTTTAMFISTAGTRLRSGNLGAAFEEVRERAGLAGSDRHPRLADMRHSFAVRTLIRWHEQGIDVQAALPILSAYLGHVSPASTYWYLSASPQLLEAAAGRRAADAGGPR